jgi:signal transduction histidine kinase
VDLNPHAIEIYIKRVAFLSSVLVMVLPPVFYSLLETNSLGTEIEIEARAKASLIESFIVRNPDVWRFQNEHLKDILQTEVLPHTAATLIDSNDTIVVHVGGGARGVTLSRSAPIREFGEIVGHIQIRDDANQIVAITLLLAIACSLLASAMFWILRTVPMAALHDSHERERSEVERRTNAELELRSAQLQLADADRLESVGRLAAGVAHEVKNPLAIIRLGVDYLTHQAPAEDETHRAVLEDIRDAVGRADRIIKDLLNFSHTRALERTQLDLNAIVENALRLTGHDLNLRRIVVHLSPQERLPQFFGDRDQLLQVFINLIVNAAQAIEHDGQIAISTRAAHVALDPATTPEGGEAQMGHTIVVAVKDTGPGLPSGAGDKIFEPFFTTKPAGEGTGLGLAVARNIVQWHGGTLELHNAQNGGAIALVTLNTGTEQANETNSRC